MDREPWTSASSTWQPRTAQGGLVHRSWRLVHAVPLRPESRRAASVRSLTGERCGRGASAVCPSNPGSTTRRLALHDAGGLCLRPRQALPGSPASSHRLTVRPPPLRAHSCAHVRFAGTPLLVRIATTVRAHASSVRSTSPVPDCAELLAPRGRGRGFPPRAGQLSLTADISQRHRLPCLSDLVERHRVASPSRA